ncbi:MAG: DegT/DnrJ/EryC1/StrS family aminotransferase [Planctomycetes bacterium]|nr:DegT/DnrJ/EryC1/StrS family aminotransferase [Planctomycetota bacterium]
MTTARRDTTAEPLALEGGPKAKPTPYTTGRRFGDEEMEELREALEQNTLFYAKGRKVRELCERFAAMYGKPYCTASSSGTAALHVAMGAAGVTVGDEVVTSTLTDAGTFIGILYQNAVPIFTDVDPRTYNMTADTVEARLTERTRAVIVVHLSGTPADTDPIVELCRPRGIAVIEDCAQAHLARYRDRLVGTIGDIGCFSLNDFKHISTGEGGLCITGDQALAQRMALFCDKCYPRDHWGMRTGRQCQFLAPNYRMSELCGAVGLAQVRRVEAICARRAEIGRMLTGLIAGVPGILPPEIPAGCESTHYYYMFRVDENVLGVGRNEVIRALAAEGVPASFYLKRMDQMELFQKMTIYPPRADGFVCPYDLPQYPPGRLPYAAADCPNADLVLRTAVILSMTEFWSDDDVRQTAAAIGKVASSYARRRG